MVEVPLLAMAMAMTRRKRGGQSKGRLQRRTNILRSSNISRRPLVVDFLLELAVAALALIHPPFFAALAMESKKRPHVDDDEPSRAKKRAVSDDHASPMPSHLNGTSASHSDEPNDGDNLEVPFSLYACCR